MFARMRNLFRPVVSTRQHRGPSTGETAALLRPSARRGGKHVVSVDDVPLSAKYDAARTDVENYRHWVNVDFLSAAAANNMGVRRQLRLRSRYEVANNSYARGMVNTVANYVVGTGPELQLDTGDDEANQAIERQFHAWCRAARVAEKLRTLRMAKLQDGEGFILLTTNDKLASEIKLDVTLIEADRVTTPNVSVVVLGPLPPNWVDGIDFDRQGNPTKYHVLRYHPGDLAGDLSIDNYPADKVIHLFRMDRPGQRRGIPEITPALPLFAQLRRYKLAVLAAAETAADMAAVVHTQGPANNDESTMDPFVEIPISQRMMVTLPDGYDISQLKAEQPTTTHDAFVRNTLNEIGCCMNMPYNIVACDSSSYNYASGRMDHQTWDAAVEVERSQMGIAVLDRIFAAWLDEAALVEDFLPDGLPPFGEWDHAWLWPGTTHVDPLKESQSDAVDLANNTTTLADIYGAKGQRWEPKLRQRARELALAKQLGLPEPAAPPQPGPQPQERQQEEDSRAAA